MKQKGTSFLLPFILTSAGGLLLLLFSVWQSSSCSTSRRAKEAEAALRGHIPGIANQGLPAIDTSPPGEANRQAEEPTSLDDPEDQLLAALLPAVQRLAEAVLEVEPALEKYRQRRSKVLPGAGGTSLCSYTYAEVGAMLKLAHGKAPGENRYYHSSGVWSTLAELVKLVTGGQRVPPVVCTVVSILGQVPCQLDACLLPVHWRPNSTDARVMQQLLEEKGYELVAGLSPQPRAVLDAGANFGLGTLIFATLWPEAVTVAVEPAEANQRMVRRNVAGRANVHVVKAGLWWRNTDLVLSEAEGAQAADVGVEWGYVVAEAAAAPAAASRVLQRMPAVSIPFLLAAFDVPAFEYVKMDIEGAELQVLTPQPAAGYDLNFLGGVRLCSVELHHNVEGAAEAVQAAFGSHKSPRFETSNSSEYQVWTRVAGS